MDEFIVSKTEDLHSKTQASSDDPVNNSKTEFSSLLIYGGSGNLYQQGNKNALKGKKTGAKFVPHLYQIEP